MVDALKLNAIDIIYGVAGIPITDLARLAQAKELRYIGFRHEQKQIDAAAYFLRSIVGKTATKIRRDMPVGMVRRSLLSVAEPSRL